MKIFLEPFLSLKKKLGEILFMRIYAFHAKTKPNGEKEVIASGIPIRRIPNYNFFQMKGNIQGDHSQGKKMVLQKMNTFVVTTQPER